MGIGDKLKGEGMKLGMKAMGKLMESPERAEAVMKAVQSAALASTRRRISAHTPAAAAGQCPSCAPQPVHTD